MPGGRIDCSFVERFVRQLPSREIELSRGRVSKSWRGGRIRRVQLKIPSNEVLAPSRHLDVCRLHPSLLGAIPPSRIWTERQPEHRSVSCPDDRLPLDAPGDLEGAR